MMIDPTALRDVFDRAASLPPQDRAAFLARACGANDRLRREVERLLAADARLGSAFDTQPASESSPGVAAPGEPSLMSGMRLGPYEIVAPLGAGGMGEVYKARDTRLDRTVASRSSPARLTRRPDPRHVSSARPARSLRSTIRTSARSTTSATRTASISW